MRIRPCRLSLTVVLVLLASAAAGLASEARRTPLVRAIERCKQAVVNIHSEKTSRDRESMFDSTGAPKKVNGMGTGIVIDERGYIVTNQHVIADVETLRVTLCDGGTFAASIVSYDKRHDLAIIKIEPSKPLTVIPLGTSSDLMLGETVIAVGNAFGYEHTITSGIISALHRDVEANETQSYQNLIQTDASINPGNSGGPLINLDGEVIGVNVAIRAGAQRIGFAIPIDDARRYVAKLLSTRKLDDTYHGLVTRDVKKPDQFRLVVESADPNSPAAAAGFQAGDVVEKAGAVRVADAADLERALLGREPGDSVDFVIRRETAAVTLRLQLAKDGGVVRTASSRTPRTDDRSWSILGLRLVRTDTKEIPASSPFRGGMRIVEVRANSPAARGALRAGDILVGLHEWETVKAEDVLFVVNHEKLTSYNPLKVFIVRDGKTLSGSLRLPAK